MTKKGRYCIGEWSDSGYAWRAVVLVSAVACMSVLTHARAHAEVPSVKTVLYGVAYYHEYMPYERLDKDVELMEQAGVTVVRLGESTWSSWEPQEGRFEFDWMDRVINRLHRAGIKVILGTPTYSIPPWLYRKHPEIMVTRLGQARSSYGPRQNMDITHPTFLFYAGRIIRQLVEHYRDHPAIIGYQIDNETSAYGTAGENVQRAFVDYLKGKFHSTAELNRVWGLVYWGQLLNDWDEFPPRDNILNPGYKLEWERFQQGIATDYLAWQAALVRRSRRPGQFIVHDFEGGIRTAVDAFAIARHLDVAGVNPYHEVQDFYDSRAVALNGDLCRSLKGDNYFITETNAQTIGWDSRWQRPPYDNQLRLSVYSHVASGADMIAYWHWHSLHYGQETYWKGVLSHDLEPNRVYREMARTGKELKQLGPRLVNLKKSNKVAILYSIDSYQGLKFMPFHDTVDYLTVLHQLYGVLHRLNVEVDFVSPQSAALERYSVLVVPSLYVSPDSLLQKLSRFVQNGGHVLMTFKSGFCNEYSTVRAERMPGPLRAAAGFSYQEFSSLWGELPLRGDPFQAGEKNRVSVWAEMLQLESARPLAYYEHPFFGEYAAITRNSFGKGTLTYEGTVLSDELQYRVIRDLLDLAGLAGPDQELPPAVKVKTGTGNDGRIFRFYMNYSSVPAKFTYPYRPGTDLLTSRRVLQGQEVELPPWDLVIVEEQ